MKIFTGVDKSLLQRAARLLEAQAAGLERVHTQGGSWAGKRKQKMEFDALLRDARDLRSLAARLSKVAPEPVVDPAQVEARKARLWGLRDGLLSSIGEQNVTASNAAMELFRLIPELDSRG